LTPDGLGVISYQVLQEYANTALTKLHQQHTIVLRQLTLLESFEIVLLKPLLIRRAIGIRNAYGITFRDSSIISRPDQPAVTVFIQKTLTPDNIIQE